MYFDTKSYLKSNRNHTAKYTPQELIIVCLYIYIYGILDLY